MSVHEEARCKKAQSAGAGGYSAADCEVFKVWERNAKGGGRYFSGEFARCGKDMEAVQIGRRKSLAGKEAGARPQYCFAFPKTRKRDHPCH